MNKTIRLLATAVVTIMAPLAAHAQAEDAGWIRNTAISPDGQVIAFTYQGDIFTVPIAGGVATQITSNPAYDTAPVWSPDGQKLAFSSNREFGTYHVYLTSRRGGSAEKLTYVNGKTQTPVAFLDNETILYECGYRPTRESGIFPSGSFSQVYSVKTTGGRPHLFNGITMKMPSINATDGRILYTDFKGYEDPLRKHHKSPVARDIWMWTPDETETGSYTKLTNFEGEDRNAIWIPGEEAFLFLSERDGIFNVYRATIADPTHPTQLTKFEKHPVRDLSMDNKGNAAFSWNGRLYYLPAGGEAKELPVQVITDNTRQRTTYSTLSRGASEAKLSPNNKEFAFILRGDVYVANIEYGTTKRITNTPEQERDLTFSPDGRTLVYSSEREDQWNLYQTTIKRDDEKTFAYATELEEKKLTHETDVPAFQPVFSPDGKKIAYLRDRAAIFCLDVASGKSTEVLNRKWNYSYSDGDQWFAWSPDSRYILTDFMGNGGWNNVDVALVKVDAPDELINLTETGYNASGARFVLDGKAIAYYSDYAGYRSHGSWGSQSDIYLMFLDQDAYDRFLLDKEEREVLLADEDESEEQDKADKKDKKKNNKKGKEDKKDEVKPLTFDFSNRDKRIVRITRTSGNQSDFVVSPKGDKFYYLATFDNQTNLYSIDLAEKETRQVVADAGRGSLDIGKDGKTIYLFGYNGFKKIEGRDITPLKYSAAFEYNADKERAYIFDHMVRQVENKFYDPNLHGVDWKGYSDNYRALLPYIDNDRDFAELCSELLGELNGSHTGMRNYGGGASHVTASLGLFYDDSYEGEGAKISEVMVGGPFDRAKSIAAPGVIVLKVNGETISKDLPIDYYLGGLVGKRTVITLRGTDGKEVEESVVPISFGRESSLLYDRWVDRRQELTKEWSNGRVGYVHIEGMDSGSFRRIFSEMLGKYRTCDAIVVDTRHNGGGWLHHDVALLLSGKEYARFQPRGQYIGSEPFMQWYKPSNMLVSEDNYSDAYGTPWTYQTLKLGKLVGTPVAGTMTAVWWETQVNPSLVFGIPQVTMTDINNVARENHPIYPEITVYNSPEDFLVDNDKQLKAAIDDLIQRVDKGEK